ncbi:MAG: protelomerase family protein [Leptolyngbyaceae cyanobacterium MO_188.B28]|nr:protelomerase family protein [Leptolyngbyaceae cyanobacterium MO_188.B28]
MRKWLQALVDNHYLPAIAVLPDTPAGRAEAQTWADWMKQKWADHGLKALKQQRNLMTEVRNAIKQRLGKDHFALESMNFSLEEWIQMNQSIDDQVASRNEHHLLLDPKAVNALVYRAVNLLTSREWADIAAGLAVLTGRRSAEIIATAEFSYKTPFSVIFTGALKRRGEVQKLSFEIPTLAQAEYVMAGLEKLRGIINAKGMSTSEVNQKYSDAVAKACDRHFADLIPKRIGKTNLYTHLFRSVYAAIATHWYCPPRIADIEFKAAIQGHFSILDETNSERRRTLVSTRHYSDYKMGDGAGNIDGRQGIRLGLRGVEVIDMFQENSSTQNGQSQMRESAADSSRRSRSLLHIFADERDRWLAVMNRLCPQDIYQPEKSSILLNWIEQHLEATGPSPETLPSNSEKPATIASAPSSEIPGATLPVIDNLAIGIAFLTEELKAAKAQITALEQQRDQQQAETVGYQQQLAQVQQTNAQLQAEITQFHQAQIQLEPLLKLLQGSQAPIPSQPMRTPTPPPGIPQQPASPPLSTGQAPPLTTTAPASPQHSPIPTSQTPPLPTTGPVISQSTAHQAPTSIATPLEPPLRKRSYRSKDTEAKVNTIINAIFRYNNTPGLAHGEKWAISFPVIKELGKPIGATYQKAIQQVFQDRQAEIDAHHQQHGLSKYHNRGKDPNQLPELIPL